MFRKHTLLKRLSFSPLSGLGSLVERSPGCYMCEELFPGSLFYSIHLYVCLYVTPNCFDYHTFVICFETWTCEILQVCSSSPRQCMAIQVPLRVHINVGIDFCISTKSAVGILVWIPLNL